MVDAIVLSVQNRVGTGTARALRRAGLVPGIIYGGNKQPMPISLEFRHLAKEMETAGINNRTFELDIDGHKELVLAREIQKNPVTDRPIHVDFLRITASTSVTVEIPVRFVNEKQSIGLTRGGVLNIVRHLIEITVSARSIPDAIEVDLSGYNIGDSIHISAVSLPEGVSTTIHDRDFTIATIAAPSSSEEAEADTDETNKQGD